MKKLIFQLFKYASCSGFMLLAKVAFMWLIELFIRGEIAYAIVQIPVFLISYVLHSKVTFRIPLSFRKMIAYFKVMITFQALDYLVFIIAFSYFNIESTLSIIVATVFIFLLRFCMVKKLFQHSAT